MPSAARATLLAVLLLACAAGCRFDDAGVNDDATRGPCLGVYCGCHDTESCAPTCGFDGCHLSCDHLDACQASCSDGCRSTASSVRSYELVCGDDCSSTCDSSGGCEITCGHDCDVRCASVGRCHVTMLDGSARCDGTGSCEIECSGADGTLWPAAADADGALRCPAQSARR